MTSGMTCNPGDIVGLPFPFSDLASRKKRPVLVLTQADYRGDFMGLAITSSTSTVVRRYGSVKEDVFSEIINNLCQYVGCNDSKI